MDESSEGIHHMELLFVGRFGTALAANRRTERCGLVLQQRWKVWNALVRPGTPAILNLRLSSATGPRTY